MSRQINPEIEKIKNYLSKLKEDKFRILLKDFLSKRCGPTTIYHSVSEHGLDLATVYLGDNDFIDQDITIMIQAKVGKVSPKELRENILGQMSELFVRTIKDKPFHEHNPRRLLLIVAGILTKEGRDLVSNWNEKMPLPIEIIELDKMSGFLFDAYLDLGNVKRVIGGKEPIFKPLPISETEQIRTLGKIDAVDTIDMTPNPQT